MVFVPMQQPVHIHCAFWLTLSFACSVLSAVTRLKFHTIPSCDEADKMQSDTKVAVLVEEGFCRKHAHNLPDCSYLQEKETSFPMIFFSVKNIHNICISLFCLNYILFFFSSFSLLLHFTPMLSLTLHWKNLYV